MYIPYIAPCRAPLIHPAFRSHRTHSSHPEVLMTFQAKPASRRLGNLPAHQISPGEPDIRGWLVVGADGRRVGRVSDVLVELHSLTARHLEIGLDPSVADYARAARIIVPVEGLQV